MSSIRRSSSSSSSAFQVIFERPDQPPSPPTGEPVFRPRRYHTKSRNGCFNCKKKRIKCSEAYPACGSCAEKGLKCEYPASRSLTSSGPSLTPTSIQHDVSRRSSSEAESPDPRVVAVLENDRVPDETLIRQGYHRSDVLELLHHFTAPTDIPWIGDPRLQNLIQNLLSRDAGRASYLLYSALAFSAAHRQHLEPANNKYCIAAPYHYQHSLRQYFEKLNAELRSEDAEALFASCQLHAFLAFCNVHAAHDGSPGIDLGWVRSMRGIRFITESPQLMASLQDGAFHAVVDSAARSWEEICAGQALDADARVGVDTEHLRNLEGLCGSLRAQDGDALLQVLSALRDLARIRPSPAAIGTFMAWIHRLPAPFVELLEAGEPLAMLAMGSWCAAFSRVDEWWIVGPARAECRKVCAYVDGLQDARYAHALAYLRLFA